MKSHSRRRLLGLSVALTALVARDGILDRRIGRSTGGADEHDRAEDPRTARIGATLHRQSRYLDRDPSSYRYQWFRCSESGRSLRRLELPCDSRCDGPAVRRDGVGCRTASAGSGHGDERRRLGYGRVERHLPDQGRAERAGEHEAADDLGQRRRGSHAHREPGTVDPAAFVPLPVAPLRRERGELRRDLRCD
jgi:hypothetical protein